MSRIVYKPLEHPFQDDARPNHVMILHIAKNVLPDDSNNNDICTFCSWRVRIVFLLFIIGIILIIIGSTGNYDWGTGFFISFWGA